jgi:hypothetical protein
VDKSACAVGIASGLSRSWELRDLLTEFVWRGVLSRKPSTDEVSTIAGHGERGMCFNDTFLPHSVIIRCMSICSLSESELRLI